MVKPIGPICNLDCTYCYYTGKKALYPDQRRFRMSEDLLETFVRDYLAAGADWPGRELVFSWQGGEPTLLGVDFFRRAVELQERYRPPGKIVRNAFQTNGVLLDAGWARFLHDAKFLVGISIDGPPRLHDANRLDVKGAPSSARVLAGLAQLQDHQVEFNTLSVVSRANLRGARMVYRYLKELGVRFMQFIPLLEREREGGGGLAGPSDSGGAVTPWSLPPAGLGTFLCQLFDEWVRRDVGSVFVQGFDILLEQSMGQPASLCVFAETCGVALAMEHNGDLFACDHYVYDDYRLGNIIETPLSDLAQAPAQARFGRDKRATLPQVCLDCDNLHLCNGGCPKHRIARAPDGEPGLNYFCPSYRRFFAHTAETMRAMADLLRAGRPAADVMKAKARGKRRKK